MLNKKDSDNAENWSGIVYLIKCKCLKKVYIVESGSRLKTRVTEHKRNCRVGNLNTDLSQLCWNLNHYFDFDFNHIKILHREENTHKRRSIESIFINPL